MGADIKALRVRIKSVDSTLHLTKAMGLVASSKIRRATIAMNNARDFSQAVMEVVNRLSASGECSKSIYMAKGPVEEIDNSRTKIIIIAGDRGLAGGYNANVFRLAANYPGCEFIPIGKRACDRYGKSVVSSEKYGSDDAASLAQKLCSEYVSGEFDRLGIISTEYVSMLTQNAKIQWLLPLEPAEKKPDAADILFEPDEVSILNTVIPEYVAGILMGAVRESFASEVAARRTAMDSAGKNAGEMIANLQLEYNRARQGAITQEITEIVAGSGS